MAKRNSQKRTSGTAAGSALLPIVDHFRGFAPEHDCSYLPGQTTRFEYRLPQRLSAAQWQELLRRGWRRHGNSFFRPACRRCAECRSLRIDIDRFRPSKSQRRTLRRNTDVTVELHRATVTPEHVRLYNDYHADMHERRGWPLRTTDAHEYADGFLAGDWEFAHEIRYRRGPALIGVGLVDLVPEGLSSIYFYHDPAWRPQGPGTFTVLQELELVRQRGGRFNYLGYWISECQSMAYKSQFRPHQILDRYVDDAEPPIWSEAVSLPSDAASGESEALSQDSE